MKTLVRIGLIGWLTLAALGAARAQGEAGDLLGRINNLRASLGLPGYTLSGTLSAAAQSQAQWIVETGVVSHTRPDGSTPRLRAQAAGYPTTEVSENIYAGTNATIGDAWNFWINSRIHYAGLTNARYKEVGIGVARSAWGTAYVLVFGNPGGPAYVPPAASAGGSRGGGARSQPSYVVGLDAHGNIMHEIQPGDTAGDIALIYGYTWADIPAMLALNDLTWDDIRQLEIGSIFLVPPKDGTYTPTPGGEPPTATAAPTSAATPTAPPPTPTAPPSPTPPAVVTAAAVPQAVALLIASPPASPSPTPVVVAAAGTPARSTAPTAGVIIPDDRPTPWLLVGLGVQVLVLAAAGLEWLRRARRR